MNTIMEKMKMLTDLRMLAEKETTTREVMVEHISNLIDDLESEVDTINDITTIDCFFSIVDGFIDFEHSAYTESEIETQTSCTLNSNNWFDYYIDKKDTLTHTEFATRIILRDSNSWSSDGEIDIIYARTTAKAIEILLDNYHGYDGDSVKIQHYNGEDWEVVGEYTWKE